MTEARLSELRESYDSASRREISDVTSEESEDGALLSPDTSVDEIEDHVAGVDPTSIYALKRAGYKTVSGLHDATPEELSECKAIGRAKVTKVIQFVTDNISSTQDNRPVPVNDEQPSPGKRENLR
jgi:DNA-directed RNA polymerase alpha subunit